MSVTIDTTAATTAMPTKKSVSGIQKRPLPKSKVQTLFDHLPHALDTQAVLDQDHTGVDHTFFTLGLKYSSGRIVGSNQRCLALLTVLQDFIRTFVTPDGKDFRVEFVAQLNPNLDYLRKCRPFAVAMDNAIEYFNTKRQGTNELVMLESDLKQDWIDSLNEYQDGIRKAKEAIVEKAMDKIQQGDTVLVYGFSEVVRDVLLAAADVPKRFDLVIISDRPTEQQKQGKGLELLSQLKSGYEDSIQSITYTSMTGLSNVIRRVTKVFLGAHALLTNGSVLAHTGTSQIALMASAHNIPVLVCCETYKFCDKSPTDSFFHNEFGTGFGVIRSLPIHESGSNTTMEVPIESAEETELTMSLLSDGTLLTPVIKYDVTPPELVTAVITDVDILPCTSVPVVLRVHENRQIKS